MQEGSLFYTPHPAFVICGLINDGHSDGVRLYLMAVLICISLIISDVEHLCVCACWPSVYLLCGNVYSGLLPIFQLGVGFFAVELYKLFAYFSD